MGAHLHDQVLPSCTSRTTSSCSASARAGTPIWSKCLSETASRKWRWPWSAIGRSTSLAQDVCDCIRVREIARVEDSCLGRLLSSRERRVVADPDDRVPIPARRSRQSRRPNLVGHGCDWLPGDAQAPPNSAPPGLRSSTELPAASRPVQASIHPHRGRSCPPRRRSAASERRSR